MKNGLIIDDKGTKRYYLNNELHRVDGPAVEWANGDNFWYVNGKFHRVDGPAEEWADGSKRWFLNGERHRVDGPAVEYENGDNFWYVNGERHRVDGPAIEWANGNKVWYLHGKELIHPVEFETMETFIQYLNDNEEYSLQYINDINGIIEIIKNPTDKQSRLNAMRWKI